MKVQEINIFKRNFSPLLPVLACGAALIYLIARAIRLPMTCDEVQTCLAFSRYSVSEIMTYSRSAIPNNHIFHTLLVKFFTSVFGMKLWATRLPNLLGFVMYFIFCYRILTESIGALFLDAAAPLAQAGGKSGSHFNRRSAGWAVALSMILMIGNAYFLDFFSLARGYGLACAWMTGSLYYGWRYLNNQQTKLIILSLLFGALAVYTNLTTLNYFAALAVYLSAFSVFHWFQKEISGKRLAAALLSIISFCALLALALFEPIRRMRETDQFVFWGSAGFYTDTFVSLTQALTYSANYFKTSPAPFLRALILMLLAATAIFGPAIIWKKKSGAWSNPLVFSFSMLCGAVIVNVLQHYLVKTPYLQTRTALFFYPLTVLPIAFLTAYFIRSERTIFVYFAGFWGMIWTYHLIRTANLNTSLEWWFDADTKKVLTVLKAAYDADPQKKKINLATNCLMQPSFWFHISEEGREAWVGVPDWDNKLHAGSAVDYYYTVSSEEEALKEKYDVVGRFNDRVLMKRKN